MRIAFCLSVAATTLLAQTAPAPVTIKWRGSVWGSAVTQDRAMPDGSLVFRPMEAGGDQATLDGLLLGGDVALPKGFSIRFTVLGGQLGKLVNSASGETGSLSYPEAMLVWTGEKDTVRFGRMITFIGYEFLDGAADITASRGLLFSYTDPITQLGLNWHHAFTPSWSTDVWAFNGEERLGDNNRGKTYGLGLSYNHAGAQDKYVSLQAYRGPEQPSLGEGAAPGAEGRMRERLCLMGQWTWGPALLTWEASLGREAFPEGAVLGLADGRPAAWGGYGAILRYALDQDWGLFARAEYLRDEMGIRLSLDPAINGRYGNRRCADLKASTWCVGAERKLGQAFLRLELRQDRLNRELDDRDGRTFRSGTSATLGLGASF